MISRYEAVLNRVPLSSVHPAIRIDDISYVPAAFNDDMYSVAKRNGSRLYRRQFTSAGVSISFEIHHYDVLQRQAICNAVCAWAKNGGSLETNDRDGQFLWCVCSKFPSVESAKNWTDKLKIEFTAYVTPFWQEKTAVKASFTGATSGSKSDLYVPGNVDGAFIEASVKANASLSSVTLTANGDSIILSGLSVGSGSTILLYYDNNGIQNIKVGTTSLLNKRTGVDDLIAKCGEENAVSFSASASVDVQFSIKGVWL